MYVGDAQDAQDDAVCAPAFGRKFFFLDMVAISNELEKRSILADKFAMVRYNRHAFLSPE